MKYQNIREEELKNKVAQDYFWIYDCTKIIGNVDFCVCMHQSQKQLFEQESLLWAEAKKGSSDIYYSIVQLILTIGKARTFDKFLPPAMLGAFDGGEIAFIPYNDIHEVFYINDFNWNVTPSNHSTKEFKLIHEKVKTIIDSKTLLFDFLKDDRELKKFIKNNFIVGKFGLTKTKIDKNNFMVIYNKWLQNVKATIAVNWDVAKKSGIIDGDFYLADLLSHENNTLKEKLFVLLKHDHYELDRKLTESGLFSHSETSFTDKQVAHTQFWNKYDRPPKEEYWDYIVERRDLLVPQDVRERKGSFFTPQIWVELSQKYLTEVLGEDWQDDYYVWDCAAGTGNLLSGLTNKYNIWASTLDKQDVEVMHDRIKNGANLLDDHVFQFDFLNDDFSKLPKPLQKIITDPEKRKNLVVYINPPYAEATSYGLKSKQGVSSNNKTYEKYKSVVGSAINELFIQFFIRIYKEIPDCKLASFSKLKYVNAQAFDKFRIHFKAKNLASFVCSANTFDNVKGAFPIGFSIWDLSSKIDITILESDVMLNDSSLTHCWQEGTKTFYASKKGTFIIDWLRKYFDKKSERIGYLRIQGTDVQQNRTIFVTSKPSESDFRESKVTEITKNNLIEVSIYFTLRNIIEPTWLNDRDQYLYPNEGLQRDKEFQNNCLAYTLFNNNIQSQFGINHWIPFTEHEVNSREKFESNFLIKYIQGNFKQNNIGDLFGFQELRSTPLEFSTEAQEVFIAGKELWKYYHEQPNCNVNASFYDIREYFQGRNDEGKMNNKSDNVTYMKLIGDLREKLRLLADKIEPKVYEYEFLKK
jgi:hypothetical protein